MTGRGLIKAPLEGEIVNPRKWREADGRYGVGDKVTRDGTDVHEVLSLIADGGEAGEFLCIVEPRHAHGEKPWIGKGEKEFNLTCRYQPV